IDKKVPVMPLPLIKYLLVWEPDIYIGHSKCSSKRFRNYPNDCSMPSIQLNQLPFQILTRPKLIPPESFADNNYRISSCLIIIRLDCPTPARFDAQRIKIIS